MNSFKINKLLDSIQIASTLHKDLTIVSFCCLFAWEKCLGRINCKIELVRLCYGLRLAIFNIKYNLIFPNEACIPYFQNRFKTWVTFQIVKIGNKIKTRYYLDLCNNQLNLPKLLTYSAPQCPTWIWCLSPSELDKFNY